MNRPIIQWEPFAPVATLEREVEQLRSINAALVADQDSLCNLLADITQKNALLQAEVAKLKANAGRYSLRATHETTGRYLVQRGR